MTMNWVCCCMPRSISTKRPMLASSSGASISSSTQNGLGLNLNIANISAMAVSAFSPPDPLDLAAQGRDRFLGAERPLRGRRHDLVRLKPDTTEVVAAGVAVPCSGSVRLQPDIVFVGFVRENDRGVGGRLSVALELFH